MPSDSRVVDAGNRMNHSLYAEPLKHLLPAELVCLVVEHAAAMTVQDGMRRRLARHIAARARRERVLEGRERERACVDRFLCSFALVN